MSGATPVSSRIARWQQMFLGGKSAESLKSPAKTEPADENVAPVNTSANAAPASSTTTTAPTTTTTSSVPATAPSKPVAPEPSVQKVEESRPSAGSSATSSPGNNADSRSDTSFHTPQSTDGRGSGVSAKRDSGLSQTSVVTASSSVDIDSIRAQWDAERDAMRKQMEKMKTRHDSEVADLQSRLAEKSTTNKAMHLQMERMTESLATAEVRIESLTESLNEGINAQAGVDEASISERIASEVQLRTSTLQAEVNDLNALLKQSQIDNDKLFETLREQSQEDIAAAQAASEARVLAEHEAFIAKSQVLELEERIIDLEADLESRDSGASGESSGSLGGSSRADLLEQLALKNEALSALQDVKSEYIELKQKYKSAKVAVSELSKLTAMLRESGCVEGDTLEDIVSAVIKMSRKMSQGSAINEDITKEMRAEKEEQKAVEKEVEVESKRVEEVAETVPPAEDVTIASEPEHVTEVAEVAPSDSDHDSDASGAAKSQVYAVHSLRGMRKRRNTMEFLVHWDGYTSDHDTWEPRANIDDTMVDEYLIQNAKTPKKATRKKRRSARTPVVENDKENVVDAATPTPKPKKKKKKLFKVQKVLKDAENYVSDGEGPKRGRAKGGVAKNKTYDSMLKSNPLLKQGSGRA